MKVVLVWLRRLRWCARLGPLILSAIVTSLLSVVSAAQTSGTCECDQQCSKTRELVTTVWGGAVTIFVLSFDVWSAMKPWVSNDASRSDKVAQWIALFLVGVLNPVLILFLTMNGVAWRYHMRRRMPGFTVLSLLSPWTKDPAKIVFGCEVVITVPEMICIPDDCIDDSDLPSLSEAVVIGRGPEEPRETNNIYLNNKGKEVLLQMDVLPSYDQLKVLQGSSGLAIIISAVQSVGYIYGVVVRTIQGLPVSPIEVVALTLSIQVLIKALMHNIVSACSRPLHVYLTHDQAQNLVGECKKYIAHEVPRSKVVGPYVVMFLLVSSVVIYYIIHMWQTTRRIMVVPIMLTLVGLYLGPLTIWVFMYEHSRSELKGMIVGVCTSTMCAMVNATSYILALVVTIKYWEVDRLNAKTSSMLAQILPYIG